MHHRQPIFPWISIPRSERASGKAAHSLLQRLSRGSWGSLLRGVQMRATRPASSTSTTSEDKLDDGDDDGAALAVGATEFVTDFVPCHVSFTGSNSRSGLVFCSGMENDF